MGYSEIRGILAVRESARIRTPKRAQPTRESREMPISTEQGGLVAKEIGAKYIECSAKTGTGVHEVFNLALKESMKGRWGKIVKQRRCVVI